MDTIGKITPPTLEQTPHIEATREVRRIRRSPRAGEGGCASTGEGGWGNNSPRHLQLIANYSHRNLRPRQLGTETVSAADALRLKKTHIQIIGKNKAPSETDASAGAAHINHGEFIAARQCVVAGQYDVKIGGAVAIKDQIPRSKGPLVGGGIAEPLGAAHIQLQSSPRFDGECRDTKNNKTSHTSGGLLLAQPQCAAAFHREGIIATTKVKLVSIKIIGIVFHIDGIIAAAETKPPFHRAVIDVDGVGAIATGNIDQGCRPDLTAEGDGAATDIVQLNGVASAHINCAGVGDGCRAAGHINPRRGLIADTNRATVGDGVCSRARDMNAIMIIATNGGA